MRKWGIGACRIRRTAENLRERSQPASGERWGIAPPRIRWAPGRAYNCPHDTAQTHAHWVGNPVASRSLDRCDAASVCDARVKRRLNSPDVFPPWPCDWHTAHAGNPAQREHRHPATENRTRHNTWRLQRPHPEGSRSDRLEGRGRAHEASQTHGVILGPVPRIPVGSTQGSPAHCSARPDESRDPGRNLRLAPS